MKLKAGSTPWRPFRCLKMLRGGWVIQEGTAVGFLLVWCGRSTTTLVAAGHSPNKFWGKNELVFLTWKWCDSTLDLSTLKTLYKRIRELAMDVNLAFAVQDVPSEAIAFSFFTIKSWPKRTANEVKSRIYPMATFSQRLFCK